MKRTLVALLLPLALVTVAARRRSAPSPEPVTFDKEIVRIFQQHCQSCHHPGDVAPFSLMSWRDAAARALEIKFVTRSRLMPPWKAAQGCGDFVGERRLTDREIDLIAAWADAGAPEGDPADLPKPLEFSGEWALGQPDVVVGMTKTFTPPADRDEYRCFSLPLDTTNTLDVAAIDFRPGDRGSVHHIVPFLDPTGKSAQLDRDGSGWSCFGGAGTANVAPIGAWAPGTRPTPLPEGMAVRIPKGSRVVMQVHYHPHFGKVLPDRTELGLYLAKGAVRQQVRYDAVLNEDFLIPANAKDFRVSADGTFPSDVEIVSVYPHMHLLGRRMKVEAILPDGASQCMIEVPDYDFNWQGAYVYRTPLALPKGSRLHIEARYDNSADNFRNPHAPPKDVRFGEASTDEMCLALVGYVVK